MYEEPAFHPATPEVCGTIRTGTPLGRRSLRQFVIIPEWDERIHLGIVGAQAALGEIEGRDRRSVDLTMNTVIGVAGKADDLPFMQARRGDLLRAHQQHVARPLDAAQPSE